MLTRLTSMLKFKAYPWTHGIVMGTLCVTLYACLFGIFYLAAKGSPVPEGLTTIAVSIVGVLGTVAVSSSGFQPKKSRS